MTKIGQKKIKIAQNCVVFFCTFSVSILLKFVRLVDWGGHGPQKPPPLSTPLIDLDQSVCLSPNSVMPKSA